MNLCVSTAVSLVLFSATGSYQLAVDGSAGLPAVITLPYLFLTPRIRRLD